MTASQKSHGDDLESQFEAYTEVLSRWPADAVHHVLETQPMHDKFFPTIYDLSSRLETLVGPRMQALATLEKRHAAS